MGVAQLCPMFREINAPILNFILIVCFWGQECLWMGSTDLMRYVITRI